MIADAVLRLGPVFIPVRYRGTPHDSLLQRASAYFITGDHANGSTKGPLPVARLTLKPHLYDYRINVVLVVSEPPTFNVHGGVGTLTSVSDWRASYAILVCVLSNTSRAAGAYYVLSASRILHSIAPMS